MRSMIRAAVRAATLLWLQAAIHVTASTCEKKEMVVVLAPTPYFSYWICNERVNAGKDYATVPINDTHAGDVKSL